MRYGYDFDRFSTVALHEAILLKHVDRATFALPPAHSRHRMATRLLIDRGLLSLSRATKTTTITELGRETLCELLAVHAERLVEAHLAGIDRMAGQTVLSLPESKLIQATA